MKFTKFLKGTTTNPSTGEIVQRIRVVADNNQEFNLLTDLTVDEIKKDRDNYLSKVVIMQGEFGFYARFRSMIVEEEF